MLMLTAKGGCGCAPADEFLPLSRQLHGSVRADLCAGFVDDPIIDKHLALRNPRPNRVLRLVGVQLEADLVQSPLLGLQQQVLVQSSGRRQSRKFADKDANLVCAARAPCSTCSE